LVELAATSLRHACIVRRGARFFTYDLGWTFGTFVHGKRADPSAGTRVKHGCVIGIGPSKLEFD